MRFLDSLNRWRTSFPTSELFVNKNLLKFIRWRFDFHHQSILCLTFFESHDENWLENPFAHSDQRQFESDRSNTFDRLRFQMNIDEDSIWSYSLWTESSDVKMCRTLSVDVNKNFVEKFLPQCSLTWKSKCFVQFTFLSFDIDVIVDEKYYQDYSTYTWALGIC